jgi:hypothetical protein
LHWTLRPRLPRTVREMGGRNVLRHLVTADRRHDNGQQQELRTPSPHLFLPQDPHRVCFVRMTSAFQPRRLMFAPVRRRLQTRVRRPRHPIHEPKFS